MSALGVGVGVGIGLASGKSVGKWGTNASSSNAITAEKMEHEMLRLVVDGRESDVTFDKFPYYLRYSFLHFIFFSLPFPNLQILIYTSIFHICLLLLCKLLFHFVVNL